jgi:hypothetical protein
MSTPAMTRRGSGSAASRSSSPNPSTPWSCSWSRPVTGTPPSATRAPRPGYSPAASPGQPISAYQLAERLRQLGIRSGQSRSAALFQLATDLPAAIPARLLGIHISAAVAWQRAAAGDWAAYAADISHRLQH